MYKTQKLMEPQRCSEKLIQQELKPEFWNKLTKSKQPEQNAAIEF
jgi:hypothetical protein